ncbi:UDP-N-acetylmuramate dehydrogenase [uncultured Veillonella sp.]|uniref:UDP-N-acetylmuramate dehydrogenase n=1 Tax=uncultured Veillonella sp. TaxID=159268 RepID=UPI00258BA4AB|nr:UDP-N-acetylmuramate dehydrogenase [uncultured Veillonella sp.]
MIMLTKKLQDVLTSDELMIDEPLSAHTTFKIGGPADIFVEPNSPEKLSRVMQLISEYKAPLTVLGSGSNVLVRDGGIRGVVLSLCQLRHVKRRDEKTLVMGAGFMLKEASEYAWQEGLSGMEFAIGIPGSLGGAVFMNAGAYDGEMSQVVTKVTAVDRNGEFHTYSGGECRFAYRHSLFQDNHEVVAEVEMTLVPGDAKKIKAVMDDLTERRESKQPLEHASAGSTFKRPPGYFAGTLIEQTGLKGLAVGDAMVSQKHAGFVVNVGTAKAKDVLAVIHEVQRRVKEAHGVDLETEVRLIGEDE